MTVSVQVALQVEPTCPEAAEQAAAARSAATFFQESAWLLIIIFSQMCE
jgi:hypothetical protein